MSFTAKHKGTTPNECFIFLSFCSLPWALRNKGVYYSHNVSNVKPFTSTRPDLSVVMSFFFFFLFIFFALSWLFTLSYFLSLSSCQAAKIEEFCSIGGLVQQQPGHSCKYTLTPSVQPAPSKQTKIISLTHSHLAYCTWKQSLCSLSHLLLCPCTNTLSSHPVCEHTPC